MGRPSSKSGHMPLPVPGQVLPTVCQAQELTIFPKAALGGSNFSQLLAIRHLSSQPLGTRKQQDSRHIHRQPQETGTAGDIIISHKTPVLYTGLPDKRTRSLPPLFWFLSRPSVRLTDCLSWVPATFSFPSHNKTCTPGLLCGVSVYQ